MRDRGEFRLNKMDGKILGVCSGLADHFDIDVTLVRVAMVLALIVTFPVVGFAYLAIAMLAKSGGHRLRETGYRDEEGARLGDASLDATRQRMRELDARLQALETYATSSNVSLAKEIDSLR